MAVAAVSIPSAPPLDPQEIELYHFINPNANPSRYFPPFYSLGHNIPKILIKINGADVVALIDTGAEFSFFGFHMLDFLEDVPFRRLKTKGMCANGSQIEFEGQTSAIISIDQFSFPQNFYLVDDESTSLDLYTILLGNDFLSQFASIRISYTERTLVFQII